MVMHRQAPTLDRRANLGIAAPGMFNEHGEWVMGNVTEHGIWVSLKDSLIGIDPSVDGIQQEADAELFARYRADVITEATNGQLSAQTGLPFIGWYLTFEGVRYLIIEAQELPALGRRRFMKIVGRLET